jgi:hypothetical protein
MTQGDWDDLAKYLITKSIPFIIVSFFVLLIFAIAAYSCIFDKEVPPCDFSKRNVFETPYSRL